ncbi:hypothetical protein [Corynebacterium sp. p3-SID1056]|uniref:hypothetical protein n=1 Tax=Corynebacterium sp. p3-SID1056 TaxID=2916092 RepID=UPI0021A41445|nr:hypothetical protein [Corynebacterium sp. p3-SID1056]MCT2337907.1 hypothetical protein [Corynebacterium sp. p3-SID1056]
MKRISTAVVAAATALAMTATPAFAAEETQNDQNVTGTDQGTENQEQQENPGEGSKDGEGSEDQEKPETPKNPETPEQPGDKDNQGGNQGGGKKQQGSAGSSNGHVVGITSGLAGATLTLALIIGSNPTGINKIIDYLNANFQLGLPHLHVPKVQLPNIPNFF